MLNTNLLLQHALNAQKLAYAPYSQFKVGAAILDEHGNIFTGCNVENVSYPCGTCAEAGAIAAMIAGGGRTICEILIVADGKQLIYPCGACLQRISEFSGTDTVVHLADALGIRKSVHLAELLPCAFNEKELKHD